MLIDHFIYTSAKTDAKLGYQVIAKSKGINDSILNALTDYLYPIGANLSDLQECKTLLILPQNKLAFSVIKIGVGFDGRSGTIYNHTMIISKPDFKKISNDTKILEKSFIHDNSLRGIITPLKIDQNVRATSKFTLTPIHKSILKELFSKKKIAIVDTKNSEIFQMLIQVLPRSMRLVPFSTFVAQPDRQPEFNLIQIPPQIQTQIKKYAIIPVNNRSTRTSEFDNALEFFLELYNSPKAFTKFSNEFDEIKSTNLKNKLLMLYYFYLFRSTKDLEEKTKYALRCFSLLQKLNSNTKKYYDSISNYVGNESVTDEYDDVVTTIWKNIDSFSKWFSKSLWWVNSPRDPS